MTVHRRRVLAAQTLLILNLLFGLYVAAFGIRDVLDPPTTSCGRAAPSVPHAIFILVATLPLVGLSGYLLRRPTRSRARTALAALVIIVLTVAGIVMPLAFSFGNGFCLVG